MNIEHAKALKVGDEVLWNSNEWSDLTSGDTYQVIEVSARDACIYLKGDNGKNRIVNIYAVAEFMESPPSPTNTQWIPFDKERMSEAVEYRFDSEHEVTEVTIRSATDSAGKSIIGVNIGGFLCLYRTNEIEMLVPVVVKYPCLCRSNRFNRNDEMHHHATPDWTPLTTEELAEIGLKQIS